MTLSATESATVYYTVDGTSPTTGSTVYSTPVSISATATLKYFAKDAAGNSETVKTQSYTIDTMAPITTASPLGGTYSSAQTVTLSANKSATIYYTTNGTTPTTGSAVYSTPVSISATATLKYFAKDAAGNSETVKTQTYTIDTVAPVTTAAPVGGTYSSAQTVTLSANESATIYYTTNGTTPTTGSAVYSTPISVSATATLKYFARDTAGNSEAVKSQSYTIDTVAPVTTATPLGGTYNSAQTVTLSANESATIYYTTNGTTPTTGSTVYSTPVSISATATLKYFAKDAAGNSETVKTQSYTIDTVAPVTTALPLGGTYNSAQVVTLSANETATIYYSTDGTTPTILYTGPVPISTTKTLKYFARDTAGNPEAVKSQTYTIGATTNVSLILTSLGLGVEWYVIEGGASLYHSSFGSTVTVTTGSAVTMYNFIDDGEIRAVDFYVRDGGTTGAVVATGNVDSETGAVTATFMPANGHTYYVTTGNFEFTQY